MAYSVTTRATLRALIVARLLSQFWSTTELNLYINEALRMWNVCTGFYYKESTAFIFSSSPAFYDVTANLPGHLCTLRMDNNTASTHPDNTTLYALDFLNPGWQYATAAATQMWAPIGLNFVALSPPSNSNVYRMQSARTAPLPTADGDYIQVGQEDMSAIVDYVVFIATLKEGKGEMNDATKCLQNFLKQAASYNAKIKLTDIYRRYVGGGNKDMRPNELATIYRRG